MGIQIEWDGDELDIEPAAERGLQAGADLLLDESNRKVPLEYGDLERSGVAVAEGTQAAVGYSSVYAARQHEELGWKHKGKGEAKYLENGLTNNVGEILEAVADEIRDALS
ncbi:hypothetical protein [Gordonia insulae]|uniref:HK97 gp10 family phage protein n=1 Tax=Gordonia insulae TaxID=2420509 RepID=A0A3G8JE79_9ACTN|nr:hypothetical protein [Gordonia insulae]AZG43446.1 hypothetical protein D7316_00010 [Gordonia insulae]